MKRKILGAAFAALLISACGTKPTPQTGAVDNCAARIEIARTAGIPLPSDCIPAGQSSTVDRPVTLADIRAHRQGQGGQASPTPPAAADPVAVGKPTDIVEIGGGIYCQRQTAGMRTYWTHVNSLPNESSIEDSIMKHLKGVEPVVRTAAAALYAANRGYAVYVDNKQLYCSMTFGKGLHQENIYSSWSNRTKLKAIKVDVEHDGYIWEFFYFPDAPNTAPIEDQGCKNVAVRIRKKQ